MNDKSQVYIERQPGDMITAEDWNEIQMQIKQDIGDQVGEVRTELGEHAEEPVDAAKFGGKSPQEWTEQFAPRVHDHEGAAVYHRYFKRFSAETPDVFIHHEMGRFPLVDVYVMQPVLSPEVAAAEEMRASEPGQPVKFLLYYAHEEAERLDQNVRVFRERVARGTPLEQVLTEVGVEWEMDDTLQDVRNELWDRLGSPPNDEMVHAASPWIEEKCIERLKISELVENDEWPDIRLAFLPVKAEPCCPPRTDNAPASPALIIEHVNYESIAIRASEAEMVRREDEAGREMEPTFDVMILLRS